MSKLSEKLEYEKNNKNISYRELSRITGINDVQIGRIFKQKMNNVIPQDLKKISKALDINYNELMYITNYSSYINSSNKFLIKYYTNLPLEEKKKAKSFLTDLLLMNTKVVNELKNQQQTSHFSDEDKEMLENLILDYEYSINQAQDFQNLLSNLIIKDIEERRTNEKK